MSKCSKEERERLLKTLVPGNIGPGNGNYLDYPVVKSMTKPVAEQAQRQDEKA